MELIPSQNSQQLPVLFFDNYLDRSDQDLVSRRHDVFKLPRDTVRRMAPPLKRPLYYETGKLLDLYA